MAITREEFIAKYGITPEQATKALKTVGKTIVEPFIPVVKTVVKKVISPPPSPPTTPTPAPPTEEPPFIKPITEVTLPTKQDVPTAVLEWAGLIYSWQQTPEAIAEAEKQWRAARARGAEVQFVQAYEPARVEATGEAYSLAEQRFEAAAHKMFGPDWQKIIDRLSEEVPEGLAVEPGTMLTPEAYKAWEKAFIEHYGVTPETLKERWPRIEGSLKALSGATEVHGLEVSRFKSFLAVTANIAVLGKQQRTIMSDLDKLAKSVSIPDPMYELRKAVFGAEHPTVKIHEKVFGTEAYPLVLVTEPAGATVALITTPFRWIGMAEPGPIGLGIEAGIMGIGGWQEEEKKTLEEQARWLGEHPGYAVGATIGDILAMKVIGAMVGWGAGRARAGIRLGAQRLPRGTRLELITKHQRIARWLGLPEEYVKVRPPVFVQKTRDVWVKVMAGTEKGYAEIGGAVSDIFKPAPRWLVPKWMERLMPSQVRVRFYGWQAIRGAARPSWMTKSTYDAIAKSAVQYTARWEGPMISQTFRGIALGPKKAIAIAAVQQSEAFALKVGMHSPSLAGVSSELAQVSSRMVPAPFMFVDTFVSDIFSAAMGVGAGVASTVVFGTRERLKAPTRLWEGVVELPTYEPIEIGAVFPISISREAQATKTATTQIMKTTQAQQLQLQMQMRTPTMRFRVPSVPFREEKLRPIYPISPPKLPRFRPLERVWPVGKIEKLFEVRGVKARKAKDAFDARELERAFKLPKTGRRR